MRKIFTAFVILLMTNYYLSSQCSSSSLIISQYLEGSSNNKCIEFYNGTGASLNLSTYSVEFYFNGSSSAGTTIALGPGIMTAGGFYVLCTSATTIFTGNQSSSASFYNGDDAIVLKNSGTIVDVFGQVGIDPGSEWGTGLCSTQDNTLSRNLSSSPCNGDPTGNDAFDPSVWASGGNCAAQDDISGLTASPLPVKLTAFNADIEYTIVKLSFSTATETNNAYFTIERSADGRSFDEIGEIKGAGNSGRDVKYEFTDESPLTGMNYYRLRQTDYDGQFSYSEIRSVRFLGLRNVSVTPLTPTDMLYINTQLEDYTIAIYNSTGQEVKKMTSLSLHQSISLEALNAGIYFVKILSGSAHETVKILKL